MAPTGARPLPLKNTTFCLPIEVRNTAGALVTSWTGAAATYSGDGGNYTSVSATPVEVQTSGTGYLNLSATEMNFDIVLVKVTVTNTNAQVMTYAILPADGTDIQVNVVDWNSTAVATPATAGVPDINVKNINNVAATSVTTVNANVGTTQPTNFTGTGASALVKGDAVDIAGAAVTKIAAGVMDYALSAVTTVGSWAKYVSDSLATLLAGGVSVDVATFSGDAATQIDAIQAGVGDGELVMHVPDLILPDPPLITNRAYSSVYGNGIAFTVTNLAISLTDPGITTEWRFKYEGGNKALPGSATSGSTGYINIVPTQTVDWKPGEITTEFVVLSGTIPIDIQYGTKNVIAGVAGTA